MLLWMNVCVPLTLYVEILNSNVMVLGGRALMSEIRVLVKEMRSLTFSAM